MTGDDHRESGDDSRTAGQRRVFEIQFPEGHVETGPLVDLREANPSTAPSATLLARILRGGCPTPADAVRIHAPRPGRTHEYVSRLTPTTTVPRRSALAAVAADRGIETPHDDDLLVAIRSLRSLAPDPIDGGGLREARRRAADAGAETERLRERVATLRGRVTALRETAGDGSSSKVTEPVTDAEATLSEATRSLSEAATERVAAAQRLALLERQARSARDQRDARIRLEDRVENCRRRVRAARAAAVADDFREAKQHVRKRFDADADECLDNASDLVDALAVARIAPIRAPLVVAGAVVDALGGRAAVADGLRAPLVIPSRE